MIPKIIHLTYKSIEEIPERWNKVIESWENTHPDWEIRFWSDEDNDILLNTEFPWFKDTYDNFPYNIQKIDVIRCCYLYMYGGVYVDMDYIPIKNLNGLFENTDNDVYLTMSSMMPVFTNSFMASKPKVNFWIEFLKSIQTHEIPWYYTKHFTIMYSTGPSAIDIFANNYKNIIGYIPPKIIHKCSVCENICETGEEEYLSPIVGQTWNSMDSKILNFSYCNYKKLLVLMGIIIGIISYNIYGKLNSKCYIECKKK